MIRAIFFTVAFLALQLITGGVVTFAVGYLRGRGADVSLGLQLLLSTSLSSLVTIALFLWLKWSSVSRQYLLSRPWAVLCWSVVASLGTILPSLLLQELMPPLPEWWQQLVDESERQMTELMNMRGGYFLIAMLVPLAEEVVFRGAILRALLQLPHNRWLMIALSALLFALAHGNPAQMPHAFLVGLLLGWLYARTGSILPGLAFHWTNNTVAYFLSKLYPDPNIELSDVLGHSPRAIVMAVVFSLFILLPALYQLHLRMRRSA